VRRVLKLNRADRVALTVKGKNVRLRRARTVDLEFARAVSDTLTEWFSPADQRAYADL
jgi:antitoxin PrlF